MSCDVQDKEEKSKEIDMSFTEIKRQMWQVYTNQADYVMLGDSLTESCDWQELLENPNVVNRGIGGNTSGMILDRIDDIYLVNPKKVFLMCGINDQKNDIPLTAAYENIVKIHEELKSHNIELVIQSTLYVSKKRNNYRDKNKEISILNDSLKTYCLANDITFIDVNSVLSSNGELIDTYTYDGVHLYGTAYLEWKTLLIGQL